VWIRFSGWKERHSSALEILLVTRRRHRRTGPAEYESASARIGSGSPALCAARDVGEVGRRRILLPARLAVPCEGVPWIFRLRHQRWRVVIDLGKLARWRSRRGRHLVRIGGPTGSGRGRLGPATTGDSPGDTRACRRLTLTGGIGWKAGSTGWPWTTWLRRRGRPRKLVMPARRKTELFWPSRWAEFGS